MACGPFSPVYFNPVYFNVCRDLRVTLAAESAPGVWTDITSDVMRRAPFRFSWGVFDRSVTACTASPGSLTFTLDNGLLYGRPVGRYSPGHANAYAWFQLETVVRLELAFLDRRKRKRFRLKGITPEPGTTGSRGVTCYAEDWLAEFAEQDIVDLALMEHARCDEAMDALIDALATPPATVVLDAGSETYPFVYDDLGHGAVPAMTLATDLVRSEGGLLVLRGDDDAGETLRLYNRFAHVLADVDVHLAESDLHADPSNIGVTWSGQDLVKDVAVQTTGRRADVAPTSLLIALDHPIEVPPGQTVEIEVEYRDPNAEADYVGGSDMQALVAETDYTANTDRDGEGIDVTADIVATGTTFGGSRATLRFQNTGSQYAFVRGPADEAGAQCRGRGLYAYAPVTCRVVNPLSIGKRSVDLMLPYQSSQVVGRAIAAQKVHIWGRATPQPRRVRIRSEATEALLEQAILRDCGDVVTVSESMTALDQVRCVIGGIEGEVVGKMLRMWWTLLPADDSDVLVLSDPDRGLLDVNVLAYG